MVVAEEVVSYFRSLKSYERIWIMCKLQHSCLPFELRFLGTCLEELGRKDFHELRQVENEANSSAEVSISELKNISNKHVQKKIILYLSLLHSHNYLCSNSLFKILCDTEEVDSFLRYEALEENDGFEQLLMIYTLAYNHPAFSSDQKQILHNIFKIIQVEENKRLDLKRNAASLTIERSDNPLFNQHIQECQAPIATSPESIFPPPQLPNPSHIPTVPPPYAHDMSIAMPEQMSIGIPHANFVRFQFPGPWSAIPVVFNSNDQTATTHSSFVSRSSSPSISNSPSRSSSPSAKGRPLSAPFVRSPQLSGPLPHQPASLPLPQTNIDAFAEVINAETQPLPINTVPNFGSNQLCRLSDKELTALGMTEESIRQLRCMMGDKRLSNNDLSSMPLADKATPSDVEVEALKEFVGKSVPNIGLVYTAAIPVNVEQPATSCSANQPCVYCLNPPMNGFVPPATAEVGSRFEIDMNALRLEGDVASRNSNGSNSDTASSDHSSPPNTPMLSQNTYHKRCINKNNRNIEWNINLNNNLNINGNNDEKSNAGDSSSEEKNSAAQNMYQGRGRIFTNNRGRSKNQNTYTRGRGNNRHRNENINGNSEDARKPNYSSGNTEATAVMFQYNNPVSAAVTNATYIPHHYIRYSPTYPTNSYLRAPSHHPYHSGELLYPQYPPPQAIYTGTAIQYTQVVGLPKLSCYNCGSQGHFANDCSESTLEEASKPSQYRLDYSPVESTFTEK